MQIRCVEADGPRARDAKSTARYSGISGVIRGDALASSFSPESTALRLVFPFPSLPASGADSLVGKIRDRDESIHGRTRGTEINLINFPSALPPPSD
jgi:hypothetical protein